MGCDIHFYVEKKDDTNRWVTADRWRKDEDEDLEEGDEPIYRVPYNESYYDGRCYDLFAILADVRNGSGFAGIDTGEGFVPIAPPRGLPEDVDKYLKRLSDSWSSDGHSHSWFTLEELLAYDWTQVTLKRGTVDGLTFAQWNQYARGQGQGPESYCGSVAGRDIRHVSVKEMEKLVKAIVDKHGSVWEDTCKEELQTELGQTYTRVEWSVSYHRATSHFWSETIPRLLALGPPDRVRIVFFFDN